MAGKVAFVERLGSALLPTCSAHEETIRSLPVGKSLEMRFTAKRHDKHHDRIWAEFTDIASIFRSYGKEHYDADGVKRLALVLTGQCDVFPLPASLAKIYGTNIGVYPNSISYAAKDEDQIRTFHDQWRVAFYEYLYPNFDEFTQRRVDQIFAPRDPRWNWT